MRSSKEGLTPEERKAQSDREIGYLRAKYPPDMLLDDVIRRETAELEAARKAALETPDIQELELLIEEMDPYSLSRPSLTYDEFEELKAAGVTPEEFAIREARRANA